MKLCACVTTHKIAVFTLEVVKCVGNFTTNAVVDIIKTCLILILEKWL